jgi:hypothetical protein
LAHVRRLARRTKVVGNLRYCGRVTRAISTAVLTQAAIQPIDKAEEISSSDFEVRIIWRELYGGQRRALARRSIASLCPPCPCAGRFLLGNRRIGLGLQCADRGENHQGCPKHCISSRDILLYCGSCCVPVNRSALHDEYNPPHGGDVVGRIAFDSNQVRLEARRHGSDLVAEAE